VCIGKEGVVGDVDLKFEKWEMGLGVLGRFNGLAEVVSRVSIRSDNGRVGRGCGIERSRVMQERHCLQPVEWGEERRKQGLLVRRMLYLLCKSCVHAAVHSYLSKVTQKFADRVSRVRSTFGLACRVIEDIVEGSHVIWGSEDV